MKVFFFLVALGFVIFANGQDGKLISKEGEDLEAKMNDAQALLKYKEALQIEPSNVYLLCKCSELCSRIGARLDKDKANQNDFFKSAKSYAKQALISDPDNSEANFAMALVRGNDALRDGGKDKIDAVKDIKTFADRSIRYDPENYKAWYVLGKWYYEINALNFFERTAVRVFFGALPPASIEDAIHCFEKTKSLNAGFILNYLSLAKAYKYNDEDHIAKENILVMLNLPDKTPDDEKIKNEGRELLKDWD